MSKKIAKQLEYKGLGFPVMLLNVPLVNIRGIEVPDIDYNVLQKSVLFALCQKLTPFYGNEIKFIRQFFEMSYTEFAKIFGVTHASVIHWEQAKNSLVEQKLIPQQSFIFAYIFLIISGPIIKFLGKRLENLIFSILKRQNI